MNHCIVVWNKSTDSQGFERHAPLEFNGERNRLLGSRVEFDVLFLEGIGLLPKTYCERLSDLGFRLHDCSDSFTRLKDRFSTLNRFGEYERNCFLRWLVIDQFYAGSSFVHYDGDIVFNATPEELERDFHGMTFMLQGCPAYTRVEDSLWLKNYLAELKKFASNIERYSAIAWQERPAFLETYREQNGALWDREVISSDQDLLQFLSLSGRIPNANAVEIERETSTALFQNPLVIGRDLRMRLPVKYERRANLDYLGACKVAFWHMQSDFCDYLAYASFRHLLQLRGRVPWVQGLRPVTYLMYKSIARAGTSYKRSGLAHRYFGEGSRDLSFLLNEATFWQSGVFER